MYCEVVYFHLWYMQQTSTYSCSHTLHKERKCLVTLQLMSCHRGTYCTARLNLPCYHVYVKGYHLQKAVSDWSWQHSAVAVTWWLQIFIKVWHTRLTRELGSYISISTTANKWHLCLTLKIRKFLGCSFCITSKISSLDLYTNFKRSSNHSAPAYTVRKGVRQLLTCSDVM